MERRPFIEVLQKAGIDLQKEYDRLYYMFYGPKFEQSTAKQIDWQFEDYPFRGTCVSLKDFDETNNFDLNNFQKILI